jgi:3-oxoacyl-[acyl-carrier protein] reductase
MRLQGKIALVTDIGSENGAAIARRFAEEGAQVAACQAAGIRAGAATPPAGVTLLEGDMSVPADAQRMADSIVERFGGLDILVTHGGGGRLVGTILDVTEKDFHEAMDGDVWSILVLSKVVLPLMKQRGGGAIVNIASIGWQGLKGRPMRATSQAAVVTLTRSMAADHAEDGIRVNGLLLGPTLSSTTPPAQARELATKSPLGQLHTPEDTANAALFLASDEARLITGALLALDAGRLLPTL